MTAQPHHPTTDGLRFYVVPLSLSLDNNPSALAEDFVQSDPILPLRSSLSTIRSRSRLIFKLVHRPLSTVQRLTV